MIVEKERRKVMEKMVRKNNSKETMKPSLDIQN